MTIEWIPDDPRLYRQGIKEVAMSDEDGAFAIVADTYVTLEEMREYLEEDLVIALHCAKRGDWRRTGDYLRNSGKWHELIVQREKGH